MGNAIFGNDDIPHKQGLPRDPDYVKELARRDSDAQFTRYYACQGLGKSCGGRMWTCSRTPLSYADAQAWVARQIAREPTPNLPRRSWEAPYLYTLLQTDSLSFVEKVLQKQPVLTDE